MLVLMGGGGFVTILGGSFLFFVPNWATYMNRLDAVLGVDRMVLKDNSVAKIDPSYQLIPVDVNCA